MIVYRKTTSWDRNKNQAIESIQGISVATIRGEMIYGDCVSHNYGTTLRKENALVKVKDDYIPFLNIPTNK